MPTGFRFDTGSLYWLHLIWVVAALGLIYVWGFHRRRVALETFAKTELLRHLVASVDLSRQYVRALLVLAGITLVALSIARPQWGSEVQEISRKGIDLVVLLDFSKSMLAEDVRPSRLARAKADLKEMLGALQGDRIGLVGFAGRAEIRCPLTFDYGFFEHVLDELEIGSVALGGTNIAQAITKGIDCYQDEFPNHKAILLITDGEDHEAFVRDAIKQAKERNIRIFAAGIGDQAEGRRIPVTDEHGNRRYLTTDDGEQVWSKMDPSLLQEAALETGGIYIPIETGAANLVQIYRDHIDSIDKKELEGFKEARYKDRYQWFLGLGLLLLLIEPLVSTRRRNRRGER